MVKAQAFLQLGDKVCSDKSPEAAVRCYRQATELAPGWPLAWRKLADCQAALGRVEDQFVSLNSAVHHSNADPEAIYQLGRRLEMSHRLAELDALIEKYRPRFDANPWLLTLQAINEWRKENLQQARSIADYCLKLQPPDNLKQSLHWLLGTLHDRFGEYAEAYGNFVRMNESSARQANVDWENRLHERVARLKQHLQDVSAVSSQIHCAEDDRGPIFVTGFPRSGTTLMGSLLNSHPNLVTRDEWSGINAVIKWMESRGLNYPQFIGALSDSDRGELRAYYRKKMRMEGSSERYVDKRPLNLIHLQLIFALYPRARVVMMIRHPYDVSFSCFSQNFRLNESMQNFLSLQSTARTYDHVMSLAKHYLESASERIHQVHYEDLTAHPQQTMQTLFAFLEVPWSPQVLEFHRHARQAVDVRSPSYHQIVQPIHGKSVERWRCYREFVAPLAAWLDPWCRYFKYEGASTG